jgi:hypothetical protein
MGVTLVSFLREGLGLYLKNQISKLKTTSQKIKTFPVEDFTD